MKKILVVEDEKYMLHLLSIHLGNEYRVVEAKDGAIALEYIKEQSYDLIILDIMLPYVDGWTLCEKIRKKGDTPILLLTARHELADKVKGLEIGADDYLVKPFEFEELKARIKALLRRSEQMKNRDNLNLDKHSFLNGLFILDNGSRQLFVNQHFVELTAKEFDLLSLLASSPSRVFTREVLLNRIWEVYESRELRVVDTHIKNIRIKLKKVEKDIKFIQTVWGVGYKLNIHEDMR
ncbi:response regulator transcription factor [Peribacillus asahii]|uniref:response regulator transcription factor n=1 Tax=Peribacillus asahii TaxID=228899 RepID=UPI002079DBBF|nr:response regulator transcription factor [Peribacillus asahii]USK62414.1 response regulator transcription factor [Peribacillus asahii]